MSRMRIYSKTPVNEKNLSDGTGLSDDTGKTVFILSVGHSGSTILDLILGRHSNVFSTGELAYLPWQIYRNITAEFQHVAGQSCSCGMEFFGCPFWSRVIAEVEGVRNRRLAEDPFSISIGIGTPDRYGEDSFWRRLKKRVVEHGLSSLNGRLRHVVIAKLYRAKIENSILLYRAIRNHAKHEVVVDSSKDILRALGVYSLRPESTFFIKLVRSPIGVAASSMKRKRSPLKAVDNWKRYYRLFDRLTRSVPSRQKLTVRYEDLVESPSKIAVSIFKFLGLSGDFRYEEQFRINPRDYHLVAGNPIRLNQKCFEIKHDSSWKQIFDEEMILRISRRAGVKSCVEEPFPQ